MARFSRRSLLAGLASSAAAGSLGVGASPAWAQALGKTKPKPKARPLAGAAAAYANAFVIDALGAPGGNDIGASAEAGLNPKDIADIRASGITAINLTVAAVGNDDALAAGALDLIASAEASIAAHPDVLMKILTAADLDTAKRTGKLGLIYGFEEAYMFGPKLERLKMFHGLGLRITQVTYNNRNLFGDGCLEPGNAGLSKLGHQLVDELNRLRIVVDLAHAGPRTVAEGIMASKAPVIFSHTACRALTDLPRNVDDAELKALGDRGGVAGIYFMPFLRTSGQPHAADVLAHLEHAINTCGEDHVGIGTDGAVSAVELTPAFVKAHNDDVDRRRKLGISAPGESGDIYNYIPEYNGPRKLEMLAFDLEKRGHSGARIEKILGGNFNRVFREVWG